MHQEINIRKKSGPKQIHGTRKELHVKIDMESLPGINRFIEQNSISYQEYIACLVYIHQTKRIPDEMFHQGLISMRELIHKQTA